MWKVLFAKFSSKCVVFILFFSEWLIGFVVPKDLPKIYLSGVEEFKILIFQIRRVNGGEENSK